MRRKRISALVLCSMLVLTATAFDGDVAAAPPPPLSAGPDYRSQGPSGAGCTPGNVDTLPRGWWAGEITSDSGTTVRFNLVCWYAGAAATRAAAEDGAAPPNDYYVRDDNPRTWKVTFASWTGPATCVGDENQPFACQVGEVLNLYPGTANTVTLDGNQAVGFPYVWIHSTGSTADYLYTQFTS